MALNTKAFGTSKDEMAVVMLSSRYVNKVLRTEGEVVITSINTGRFLIGYKAARKATAEDLAAPTSATTSEQGAPAAKALPVKPNAQVKGNVR